MHMDVHDYTWKIKTAAKHFSADQSAQRIDQSFRKNFKMAAKRPSAAQSA